jgi:hypothetical protein
MTLPPTTGQVVGLTITDAAGNVVGNCSTTNPLPVTLPAGATTSTVKVAPLTTAKTSQASLSGASAQILAAPLANRASLTIKAHPSNTDLVYVSTTDPATSGNGFPLAKGESYSADLAGGQALYAIVASGTQVLCFVELGQ